MSSQPSVKQNVSTVPWRCLDAKIVQLDIPVKLRHRLVNDAAMLIVRN
jgi:hypothetical protein